MTQFLPLISGLQFYLLHISVAFQVLTNVKVSGSSVETSCVFMCMKNIINAEIWA